MELFNIQILIQTFLAQLPTCQDGFQNCGEVLFDQPKTAWVHSDDTYTMSFSAKLSEHVR